MPIVSSYRGTTFPSLTVSGATVLQGQNTQSGQPFLYLTRAATQSIANNSSTTIAFDTTVTSQGDLSPSAGVVTVGTAGIYLICAGILWASNATGTRAFSILKGATTLATSEVTADGSSTTEQCVSQIISCAASDTIKVNGTQVSTAALNCGGVANATFMAIFRLG